MVGHIGGKAAFVADCGADALVVQDFFERVEDFCAIAQGFAKARSTHGDDHQLLQVEVVVGVLAAVDDVHHGHGQLHCSHAAKVAVQRQAGLFCSGAGHGHGDSQHGVGAQAGFVFGAVQVDQGFVQEGLLGCVQTQHSFQDFGIDVFNGLEHALAQVARLVAVAQFDGFARAGGGPAGYGRTAHGSGFQQNIAFHRGVATGVENFAADDINNSAHGSFPFKQNKKWGLPDPAAIIENNSPKTEFFWLRNRLPPRFRAAPSCGAGALHWVHRTARWPGLGGFP